MPPPSPSTEHCRAAPTNAGSRRRGSAEDTSPTVPRDADRVCGGGGGSGRKATSMGCVGVRPPVVRPSETSPRSPAGPRTGGLASKLASKRGGEHTCPDRLPRRIGSVTAAAGPPHLRTPWPRPAPAAPAEPEARLDGRRPRPPRRRPGPWASVVPPPQARQLRHRRTHRGPGADEGVPPRRTGGAGPGRAVGSPEPADAGLGRAGPARPGTITGPRTRAQPGGTAVVPAEEKRARRPGRRPPRRCRRRHRTGHPPDRHRPSTGPAPSSPAPCSPSTHQIPRTDEKISKKDDPDRRVRLSFLG